MRKILEDQQGNYFFLLERPVIPLINNPKDKSKITPSKPGATSFQLRAINIDTNEKRI